MVLTGLKLILHGDEPAVFLLDTQCRIIFSRRKLWGHLDTPKKLSSMVRLIRCRNVWYLFYDEQDVILHNPVPGSGLVMAIEVCGYLIHTGTELPVKEKE